MRYPKLERIQDLPLAERPREKLLRWGVGGLSDRELLAVLLGSGTRERGVERIAADLADVFDNADAIITRKELEAIQGMGTAKAALILAALEFSRRRFYPERRRITKPADVLPLVQHYEDRKQEHFLCLSLNGAHEVLSVRVVSIGLLNRALVHPREVFADPLTDRAAAVIIAHNHPSGNVDPSPEDRDVTDKLKRAGETLGVQLLDHIIFSSRTYYSFLEDGFLRSD